MSPRACTSDQLCDSCHHHDLRIRILATLEYFLPYCSVIRDFDVLIFPWIIAFFTGKWTPECDRHFHILSAIVRSHT